MIRAAPAAQSIQDPSLGRGQRLRRLARDLLVDRVCGRIGLRVVRLPGRVCVFAETVDCLQHRLDVGAAIARRVTVVVAWWRAPWRGWSGRVGPLPALVRHRVGLPRLGRGMATVDIRVGEPVLVCEALAAALHALRPVSALPGAGSPIHTGRVLVDAERVNPRGRRPDSYRSDAPTFSLELAASDHKASNQEVSDQEASHRDQVRTKIGGGPLPWRWPGASHWRRGRGADLAWPTITALRAVGVLEWPTVPSADATAEASLLVQLAMTGVVVHAPRLAPSVADLLAVELRDILREPLPEEGPLGREIRSVRQRRAAMREHSTRFATAGAPSVSAILATKRAEHLPSILHAIAGQTYPHLEIVLCLHGIDLPKECKTLLADCGRPVEIVPVPADVTFGIAVGLATARASGTLLTKFDDDDTYGPEHVWDLVLARHYSGATLVGKGIEFVYLESADVTVRRRSGQPESEDSVVAGGTMLIGRGDLEELGGWRPVPRSVDRGLLDRLVRAGAVIYRTHPLGYVYHRRAQGHTWAADDDFFLRTARQRWDGLLGLAEFSGRGPAERTAG